MLNLKKILRNLTLRKIAEESPYAATLNNPRDMIKRVQGGIVHDKYLAQAHIEYLQKKWLGAHTDAVISGDKDKENDLYEKMLEYPADKIYSYHSLRKNLKNDPFWPHLYDKQVPENASVEEKEKYKDYTIKGIEETEDMFKQDALDLEKVNTEHMLYKLVSDSFKEHKLVQGGQAYYDKAQFEKPSEEALSNEEEEGSSTSVKVSEKDYDYAIDAIVNAFLDSPEFIKNYNPDKELARNKNIESGDPLDIFTSYVQRVTPKLFQQYLHQDIVPELNKTEEDNIKSLDDPVVDEFGREAPVQEHLYDPSDTADVETGKGLENIKVDILGDLAETERKVGMPLEEYVGTEAFEAHSLLRQLSNMWQKVLNVLPYQEEDESAEQRLRYQGKLRQSKKNIWDIKNLNDLNEFVDAEDLLLLQGKQNLNDPESARNMFEQIRSPWADKINEARRVLRSPRSTEEEKAKSKESIKEYEDKISGDKGKGGLIENIQDLDDLTSFEDFKNLKEFAPLFKDIQDNKEANLRDILWTFVTEPKGFSPTYYNNYFQETYKDILEDKPDDTSFTEYFYDAADLMDVEHAKGTVPDAVNASNNVKILNDIASTEKEVKKPLSLYMKSPEFIVQASLQEFRSAWRQGLDHMKELAEKGELSTADKIKMAAYEEKLKASDGVSTIKTSEELSNIVDKEDLALLGNRTSSDIVESIGRQKEFYLKYILWSNSSIKDDVTLGAYSKQAERVIDAKPENMNFIQFYNDIVKEDTSTSSPEEIGSTVSPSFQEDSGTTETAEYNRNREFELEEDGPEEIYETPETPEIDETPEPNILDDTDEEDDTDKKGILNLRRRKVSLSLR